MMMVRTGKYQVFLGRVATRDYAPQVSTFMNFQPQPHIYLVPACISTSKTGTQRNGLGKATVTKSAFFAVSLLFGINTQNTAKAYQNTTKSLRKSNEPLQSGAEGLKEATTTKTALFVSGAFPLTLTKKFVLDCLFLSC